MGLHGYKSFISNSVPVAQNYRIRPKHRRKIRQSNNRQNSLYSAGSLTERTVLRMVHRFVRGAPRGFIDSKSTTFFPWSSEVLWEVISKNTGTVKFCSHFFQWGFQVPNSNTWTKQNVSSCCCRDNEHPCAINSIWNIDAGRPLLLFNCGNLNTVIGLQAGTARNLSSMSNRGKRHFCCQKHANRNWNPQTIPRTCLTVANDSKHD
jgi:hypothetical protein